MCGEPVQSVRRPTAPLTHTCAAATTLSRIAPPTHGPPTHAPPHAKPSQSDLPEDFDLLRREAGLASFVAEPIGPRASPLGALILGKREARGFDDKWWAPGLGAARAGFAGARACHKHQAPRARGPCRAHSTSRRAGPREHPALQPRSRPHWPSTKSRTAAAPPPGLPPLCAPQGHVLGQLRGDGPAAAPAVRARGQRGARSHRRRRRRRARPGGRHQRAAAGDDPARSFAIWNVIWRDLTRLFRAEKGWAPQRRCAPACSPAGRPCPACTHRSRGRRGPPPAQAQKPLPPPRPHAHSN